MGCGRVGATLAVRLEQRGHSVAIIDQDPDAFRRLPVDFEGQQVTGVGFDREALRQAGIEDASGFAAASSGDNSNIIAARVVRDTFGIDNVVARIYDSSRARIFNRLGIDTVAPAAWTADRMMHSLIALGPHTAFADSTHEVSLIWADLDDSWFGMECFDIERITRARIAYISREDEAIFPTPTTVLQDGDKLAFLVKNSRILAVQRILNHPVAEEQR
ncbi:MAG: TrkA family potassium uptake protein [Actinomycetaceae bacterium]|nr:TrkA family potassium uptake protein [Actinomycetaceae bacterium]